MQAYVKHTGAWMPWNVMHYDDAGDRLRGLIRENVDSDQLEFRFMLMYSQEIGESAMRGPQRQIPQSCMSTFKEAGLSEDFVVTYSIGLGYGGDHQDLRKHYQAAGV